MKPESWKHLPGPILEQFLWDCELEYDSYESSKAERVHSILNGSIYEDNQRIVDTAWKFMSEDSFRIRCENARNSLKSQLEEIQELLDKQ